MQTPYFSISKKKLDENIKAFQEALNTLWPNSILGYSVKTNSLPWVLEYLCSKGIYAEVVSDEEYQLARLTGYPHERIIFNGPVKGKQIFSEACNNGSIINIDSQNDLKFLKKYGHHKVKIGVRVNINPEIFAQEDIGYEEDGFRFGFSDETGALKIALEHINAICKKDAVGLHLHCNSVTRSLQVYKAVAEYAAKIIKKHQLEVDFIDIGGGFFGGVPGKTTPFEYIKCIKNELERVIDIDKTKLIIEPGSAIIGSVVDLHTMVIDVKDTCKSRIVTTDGSRIHIDPLWIKKQYMFSIQNCDAGIRENIPKQVICGYTCMDHDRLMIIENHPELTPGDIIRYHRVGAYTMTFGGMFIRYYPDIYVEDGTDLYKVRNQIDVKDYIKIHTNS